MANIVGTSGADTMWGTGGDDEMSGNSGADKIAGLAGNDRIFGNGGADKLFGNAGDDDIRGGYGDDIIRGGIGNDEMRGGVGDDKLIGGEGNDTLIGGAGDDVLRAGLGDDEIHAGLGDRVYGGQGEDKMVLAMDFDISMFSKDGYVWTMDTGSGSITFSGIETIDFNGTEMAVADIEAMLAGTAPEVADAPESANGAAVRVAEGATITDADEDWDGGSITVAAEDGKYLGQDAVDANDISLAGVSVDGGLWSFDTSGAFITATPLAGGDLLIVAEMSNGDEVAVGDPAQMAYSSQTVTFTSSATQEIVGELAQLIAFNPAVDDTGAAVEATLTVTVADGAGNTTEYMLDVDPGAEPGIADFADSREVELSSIEASAGVTIDQGGDAAFTEGGLELDGATMTVSSDIAGDVIDLLAGSYAEQSGKIFTDGGAAGVIDGADKIIGDISGNGTNSVTITFDQNAMEADVTAILQSMTVKSSEMGDHTITTELSEASGFSSVSAENVLSVVGDFQTIATSALTAATSGAPVTIDQNTNIEIDDDLAIDVDAFIADGKIVVTGSNIIRVSLAAADHDISGASNLGSLGELSLNAVGAADTLTMNVAQALAFGEAVVEGTVAIDNLEEDLTADLSGMTAQAGATATIATGGSDLEFTGDFGDFEITVAGGGTLSAAAAILNGATIDTGAVVSDPGNVDGMDLSGSNPAIAFEADATIANGATVLGTGAKSVAEDVTLTIAAGAADGATIAGDNASANGKTGGSIVVTGVEAATDLSGLTAGTDGGFADATAGTLSATVTDDITFTGDFGDASVEVAAGNTLTTTADKVDGASVSDDGTVAVTDLGTASADLTGITAITDLGDALITVDGGHSIVLTEAQADGLQIKGNNTGDSLEIKVADGSTSDFSNIGADFDNGVNLTVTGGADLTGATLGDNVSSVTVNDGDDDTDADYTVTLTAAQAHAIQAASGGAAPLVDGGNDGADVISLVTTASASDAPLTILGAEGNDTLAASDQDDILTGGAGADEMTGGAGDDTFVFAAGAAGIGAERDVITDFEGAGFAGGDEIALSGGSFIGTSSFDGNANEIRYGVSGSDVIIEVDVDADSTTDFQILLVGVTSLSGQDFDFT